MRGLRASLCSSCASSRQEASDGSNGVPQICKETIQNSFRCIHWYPGHSLRSLETKTVFYTYDRYRYIRAGRRFTAKTYPSTTNSKLQSAHNLVEDLRYLREQTLDILANRRINLSDRTLELALHLDDKLVNLVEEQLNLVICRTGQACDALDLRSKCR